MNIDDLLLAHPLISDSSCVAWGYEFVAKWHKKLIPLTATPIQDQYPRGGIGFEGDFARQFEITHHLQVERREVSLNELEQIVREEDDKGVPLLCSVFSGISMKFSLAGEWQSNWHTFVGINEPGKGVGFLSRRVGADELIVQTIAQLRGIDCLRRMLPPHQERKVECLLHRLA